MTTKTVIKKSTFTLEEFYKTIFDKKGVCLISIFYPKKYDDRGVPLYSMFEVTAYKQDEIKVRGLDKVPLDSSYFKDVYTSFQTAYTLVNSFIIDAQKNPNAVVTVTTRKD